MKLEIADLEATMKLIRIVVGGSTGRMSQCIASVVEQDPEVFLMAQTSRAEGGLQAIQEPFDVFIDFTHPLALETHLDLCCQAKRSMVVGVTGLSANQKAQIDKASQTIPIVYSPNMSVGVNLSFKLLALAAQTLGSEVEVAIQEIHHKHKKDKPSGTALKMGEIIAEAAGPSKPQIDFAASRIGEVKGEHTVLFALPGEQLEIKHKTEDRAIFARGAVLAAKWLMNQPPGLYDMQGVLGLKTHP